jgi:hypothetical protein
VFFGASSKLSPESVESVVLVVVDDLFGLNAILKMF